MITEEITSQAKILNGVSLPNIPWQDKPEGTKGPVWRYSQNPVIDREPFEGTARVYNSAVLPYGQGFIGVFRADGYDSMPQLNIGRSKDAINWEFEEAPIEFVDKQGNPVTLGYTYDPRLVRIEDTYYIIWCNEFHGPTIGLAKTEDFKTFTFLDNAFLPYNRNGVLFPRRINGEFMLLSRPSDSGHTAFGDVFLSRSRDLVYWGKHEHVMGASKETDWWQNLKIGAGPAPLETSEGWLMFYHGVTNTCNGYVYSMGAALLDLENPGKVLKRSKGALLPPVANYEAVGHVPNVVFPCGILADADTGRIAVYYGAADSVTAVAFTEVNEIIEHLNKNSIV